MDTKYLKKVGIYFLSVILALALIFYIIYHLLDGFTTDISTVTAEIQVNKSVINSEGYIFRDEHYVYSSYNGSVNYNVGDGEKVGIKQALAETFSDSSGYSVRAELSDIEKRLEILKESKVPVGAAFTDTETVDKKISTSYYMILSNLAEGKFSHAMRATDNMLVQMNRRQVITGEQKDFSSIESSLEARKATLTAKLTGRSETVYSDTSGYFFIGTDGYEQLFTESAIDSLSVSSFYDLISKSPNDLNGSVSVPIGKIAESYIWYIALPVSLEQSKKLETGKTYEAIFPYNYDTKLTLKAEKILTENKDNRAVAVFSCSAMPTGFSYMRSQSVEIIVSSSEGYRVPSTSVRLVDGYEGVYTLYGSTVEFKRIHILMELEGYYIVSTKDPVLKNEDLDGREQQIKYSYIDLYDQIIISGKELKHGMVFY